MSFDMTNEQWNAFAEGLDAELAKLTEKNDVLLARIEAVEAFILRRPTEPIPQPIIDAAIEAQQPSVVEPVAEPEDQPTELEEETP